PPPRSTKREAAFGRDLLASFGDEGGLIRLEASSDLYDLGCGAELEIQHGAHGRPERANVGVLDVPAILPQVDGDAVGAGALGRGRGGDGIRLVGATCLAHRRDVINVDVEPHGLLPSVHSGPTRGSACETTTDRARRVGHPRVRRGAGPGQAGPAIAAGDPGAVPVGRETE